MKVAPIPPTGPKSVAHTDFVYTDENFAITGIRLYFLSFFRRSMTERVRLKRIFTGGEFPLLQWLCIL